MKGKICGMNTEGDSSILSLFPEGLYSDSNKTFTSPKPLQSTG